MDTRAKDSDRNNTCQVLDTALSEGQLSMEEHRQRVSAATNATTLGELQSLVSDLQTSNAPVQLPALKSRLPTGGWGMRSAVGVVLVLLGVGIGWGLYGGGHSSSPFSFCMPDPGAKPDGVAPVVLTPPKQLQSLGGLTGLMEVTRKKFGDTVGYRLVIYPDYAVMDRADPQDDRRQLSYTYRGGWGDPTGSARDGDAVPVDLGTFDPKAVVGIVRGAAEISTSNSPTSRAPTSSSNRPATRPCRTPCPARYTCPATTAAATSSSTAPAISARSTIRPDFGRRLVVERDARVTRRGLPSAGFTLAGGDHLGGGKYIGAILWREVSRRRNG
jgi:Domain of unknown function (DUF1707)